MEVTFNFLEIRAMNTYPEHQVRTFVSCHLLPDISVKYYNGKIKPMSLCYRLSSTQTRPPTLWGCRPRTSWITWSATSTTPSPECSTTPFMRKHRRAPSSLSGFVSSVLKREDKLADANSSRHRFGKLAASRSGASFPPQQPNAFLYRCTLHPAHFLCHGRL